MSIWCRNVRSSLRLPFLNRDTTLILQKLECLVYMPLPCAENTNGKAYASDPVENSLRQQNIMPCRNSVIEYAIQIINIGQ